MIYCALKSIKQSNLGTDSADDFPTCLKTPDLNFTKFGNNASNRNQLVVKALSHLDDIDFDISNTEADVVGYAHEYRIGESTSGAGKKNPASSIPRKRYQPYRPRWSPKVNSARFPCMIRPAVQVTCCCGRSVKVKTWI